jgi:hypothetical protein
VNNQDSRGREKILYGKWWLIHNSYKVEEHFRDEIEDERQTNLNPPTPIPPSALPKTSSGIENAIDWMAEPMRNKAIQSVHKV